VFRDAQQILVAFSRCATLLTRWRREIRFQAYGWAFFKALQSLCTLAIRIALDLAEGLEILMSATTQRVHGLLDLAVAPTSCSYFCTSTYYSSVDSFPFLL
jgi:hypothetical protein